MVTIDVVASSNSTLCEHSFSCDLTKITPFVCVRNSNPALRTFYVLRLTIVPVPEGNIVRKTVLYQLFSFW